MHVTRVLAVLLIVSAVLICGCLPIELSVSTGGQVLIPRQEGFCSYDPATGTVKKIYVPKSQKPAMGLFSPDDKSILTISQTSGGGMGSSFAVKVVNTADGKAKALLTASNVTYARWSPDSLKVAVTRVADKKKAPLKEQLPELILASPAMVGTKVIAGNVSKLVRWFPDSKSVLSFQISSKSDDTGLYTGQLVKIDMATSKAQPLAQVMGDQNVFFDLSPDGKSVLFTAAESAKIGGKLPAKPKDHETKLFKLDVASGAVSKVAEDVVYAIYSPKGTKVLLGQPGNNAVSLKVAGPDLKTPKTIVTGAVKAAGSGPGNADVYPSWSGEDKILFLTMHAEFGTAGQNLHLVSIGADGTGRKDHQTAINAGLAK
ncbi:MAG: hypothetical protein QGG42_22045 [Phycisphaerae bacterium]|jgi:dipeptidyl aminopeptidase/acylaminoacyl peptidase|nr:hypothetical protein [Phycisphaerae bacterium]